MINIKEINPLLYETPEGKLKQSRDNGIFAFSSGSLLIIVIIIIIIFVENTNSLDLFEIMIYIFIIILGTILIYLGFSAFFITTCKIYKEGISPNWGKGAFYRINWGKNEIFINYNEMTKFYNDDKNKNFIIITKNGRTFTIYFQDIDAKGKKLLKKMVRSLNINTE